MYTFQPSAIAKGARDSGEAIDSWSYLTGKDKLPPLPGRRGTGEDIEKESGIPASVGKLLFCMLKEDVIPMNSLRITKVLLVPVP